MSWPSALPSKVILATDAGGHSGTYGVLERLKQGWYMSLHREAKPETYFRALRAGKKESVRAFYFLIGAKEAWHSNVLCFCSRLFDALNSSS